jgi:hypothetical protein
MVEVMFQRDGHLLKNCHFFQETLELERVHLELRAMERIITSDDMHATMVATAPTSMSLTIDLHTAASRVLLLASKYESLVNVGFQVCDASRAMLYSDLSFFMTARAVG